MTLAVKRLINAKMDQVECLQADPMCESLNQIFAEANLKKLDIRTLIQESTCSVVIFYNPHSRQWCAIYVDIAGTTRVVCSQIDIDTWDVSDLGEYPALVMFGDFQVQAADIALTLKETIERIRHLLWSSHTQAG